MANDIEPTTEQINAFLAEQVNEKIEAMESEMLQHDQVEMPVEHRFINGMYARELTIPKGTLLTGRVHKFGYVDIMLSGDITVATPDGVKRLTGTHILEGVPGRKRAGYAHEDTHWITVHRTNHADPESIVDHLTFFSMAEYRSFRLESDRASYGALLEDMGMTEGQVQEQVQSQDDQTGMPAPYSERLALKPSPIHGLGIYALESFNKGAHIGPARIDGKRTPLGRYVNHSSNPNAQMTVLDNGDVAVVASRPIYKGEEVTTDYRHTINQQQGAVCQQLPQQ